MTTLTALIGLFGVVFGVLLGKSLEWVLDEFRRRRRRVDMVFALHAEISAGRDTVAEQTAPAEATYFVANPTPASPADRTDFVFNSLKTDLSVLPQSVIHSVVLYYRLAEQTNLMVEFIAHPLYERQDGAERARYARYLLEKLDDQEAAARMALDDLEAFIHAAGLAAPRREPLRRSAGAPPQRVPTGASSPRSDEGLDRSRHD